MKRIKIFKAYFILWLFVYFIVISNVEIFVEYFMSTLTFNIAIVSILGIGTFMLLKASKDLVMIAGTFGVLMYKKRNLLSYLKGIEKILPSNTALKIKQRAQNGEVIFTQQEKEEFLLWMGDKFANQNKYNNFFVGTVLMIGLLGTFAGLLGAIGDMGGIVLSLAGSDVDIGKIMAGFSGPLGSMAMGFGSSLFGVISAILLSIKGYLLNKSQETLQEGIENWMNSKTLDKASEDSKDGAMIPSSSLNEHQPSFTDIFIEKIGMLTHEIQHLTKSNQVQQDQFINAIALLNDQYTKQQHSLSRMQESLIEVSDETSRNVLISEESLKYFQNANSKQSDFLEQLIELQETGHERAIHFSDRINQLATVTKQSSEQLARKDKALFNLVLKQEERTQNEGIEMFNVVDAIESMHKNLDKKIQTLQTSPEPKTKEFKSGEGTSFIKQHLNKNMSEKV